MIYSTRTTAISLILERYSRLVGFSSTPIMRADIILTISSELIRMGSPKGYYWKGLIYWEGLDNIPRDQRKAMTIWEEADKVGMAHRELYDGVLCGLITSYM